MKDKTRVETLGYSLWIANKTVDHILYTYPRAASGYHSLPIVIKRASDITVYVAKKYAMELIDKYKAW